MLVQDVFVAESAVVLGNLHLGDHASVWYGSVIRGDVHEIRIGDRTNIQDRSVIHVTDGRFGTYIGEEVTVGHGAILHGCRVGDRVLIGMGASVLDDVRIGSGSVVGAGALLPPGKIYPSGVLIVGAPAKTRRELTDEEQAGVAVSSDNYVKLAARHAAGIR